MGRREKEEEILGYERRRRGSAEGEKRNFDDSDAPKKNGGDGGRGERGAETGRRMRGVFLEENVKMLLISPMYLVVVPLFVLDGTR